MLFNSYSYIFLFLPITLLLYFSIAKRINCITAKAFLVLASFFFYGWWNPIYIPLLIVSILINYFFAHFIQTSSYKRHFLIAAIIFNLGLLAYFKYSNFFIDNINILLKSHIEFAQVILPLGISFFTFTQIAFLVDIARHQAKKYGFINYCLFVSYFPHLLAGPIIHHASVMPQFADPSNSKINYKNLYFGLILFFIGLCKKVILADTFALIANAGYADVTKLTTSTAWITALAYTFQIYFDFSGYTDMAIGVSRMFNVELPINFNSPYKAENIKDFWHRWHITLSQFLRDYLYIPLGGNRVSESKIYRNLLITFILGGFWHGAGWTFIIWGFLHGIALSVHRAFGKLNVALPKLIAWFITFNFINVTWVFFRSTSLQQAKEMLVKMFFRFNFDDFNLASLYLFMIAFLISLRLPNSIKMMDKPIMTRPRFAPIAASIILLSIFAMEINNSHEFIYFNF